ncbi:MAG: YceD family protein [Neisseria sp.]|nr:YceD family protein [Neisseria sp.]
MLTPYLIDPAAFASEKRLLEFSVALRSLDERVWSHEYFAGRDAEISIRLKGGTDSLQRPFLDLEVKAGLSLQCQRCMKPVEADLDETARIVLFFDEGRLDEAMLSDEELEGMLCPKELDVRELAEDQILMAMPYAPRHEECGNEMPAGINQDKPNPFAVLAGLKRNN